MVVDPEIVGSLILDPADGLAIELMIGEGQAARKVIVTLDLHGDDAARSFESQQHEPMRLRQIADVFWAFRGVVVQCDNAAEATLGYQRLMMLLKRRVLREERRWAKIEREIEAFENMDRAPAARREHIPDSVRLFVWQRDEGKCVQCGSESNLEFDHIIPVVKGGANTERNIRLLCETCNRRKGADIA